MIIKFLRAEIDTDDDHKIHMTHIKEHVHCGSDRPEVWWVERLNNGDDRFVHLEYTSDGKTLMKIYAEDHTHGGFENVKERSDQCFFTKNNPEEWKTNRKWINRRPSWINHATLWTRDGGFEVKCRDLENATYPQSPTTKETVVIDTGVNTYNVEAPRKKKWGIF